MARTNADIDDDVLRQEQATCSLRTKREAADHDTAAASYEAVRRSGQAARSLLDCLVAAAALRHGGRLLAKDRDRAVIARVSPRLV